MGGGRGGGGVGQVVRPGLVLCQLSGALKYFSLERRPQDITVSWQPLV